MRWCRSPFRIRFWIWSTVVFDHLHGEGIGHQFPRPKNLSFLVEMEHERANHGWLALRHQPNHPGNHIVDEKSPIHRSVSHQRSKNSVLHCYCYPGGLFWIQDRNQELQHLFGTEVLAVTNRVSILGVHGFAELTDNVLVGP